MMANDRGEAGTSSALTNKINGLGEIGAVRPQPHQQEENGMSEKLDAMYGVDAANYIRQLQAEIVRLRAVCEDKALLLKDAYAAIERLTKEKE